MRTALLIAGKDLRQRLRDRTLIVYALLLPLGLAFLFHLVFGGADGQSATRLGVLDDDRGAAASRFTEDVLRPAEASGAIEVRTVSSRAEGERLVEGGDLAALFVIPRGFTAAVESGAETGIEIVGDEASPTGAEVARAIATAYTSQTTTVRLAVALTGGDPQAAQQAVASSEGVVVENVGTSDKQLDWGTYMAAGMAVFFLFFTVQFGASGLLEEREKGTLARLMAAPVSRTAVLAGKLLLSVFVGVVSMALLMAAMALLFDARWGDPAGVALVVLAGVLAATALMAAVAAFADGYESAGNRQAVVAIVLGALGGAFFPVARLDGPMGEISKVSPHYWFLQSLSDLSGGASVGDVLPGVAVLAAFAAVAGGVAVYGWRREAGA